ncbi:DUF1415 domain-containing protein [Xylophilus sp.]|uniref:DUF1415 domain-containing protein n=1 Tax=Xylophilus sp. TaxID=2653893 RepID=UPI0013B9AE39|nr:DUF1415 domain-containing protein [Xylophilus sp.]KAF1044271.1 MAG: hypothetical protein GAK38_03597 [Xylophilus sp.]
MSSPADPLLPALAEAAARDTVRWIERAVIGLNLCPFAKGVHTRGQVHYHASAATTPNQLREDLERELRDLVALPAEERDTTLLIVPRGLEDFLDFNDFLGEADALLASLGLEGEVQIASFHPDYRFAGTRADDVTNCTNRAPWPTLHLLREASIDRAVAAFPEAEAIYQRNMATLEKLGKDGWRALDVGPTPQEAGR